MAASTIEVLLKFTGDPRNAKDAIAQVRADLTRSAQQQVTTARNANKQVATEAKNQTKTLEQEERARTRAAESLQRQRSAALIAQWKLELREKQKIEQQKQQAEQGGGGQNLTVLLNSVPVLRGVTTQLGSLTTAATGAGGAMAGLAGPIGIATTAMVVQTTATLKLAQGLFELARQTADYRGKLFDLSQQVNLSVESLSALEVLAATTGGSIDTVAASIAIFQRNLEAAEDPTSKEAKLLAELGVTSRDTEEALRETLKALFEMGEGSKQTAAVFDLFGRSGRFVNAILKESKGDLDAAIARFRELGIVVSTQDAKAADEFNDTLATLQFQLRATAGLVGQEVIPLVLQALKDLQQLLKQNRDVIQQVGLAAKVTAAVFAKDFNAALGTLNIALALHKTNVEAVTDIYERLVAAMQFVSGRTPMVDPNAIPSVVQQGGQGQAGSGAQLLEEAGRAFRASRDAMLKPFDLKQIFGIKEAEDAERRATQEREKANRVLEQQLGVIQALNLDYKRLKDQLKDVDTTTKSYAVAESQLIGLLKDASPELIKQAEAIAKVVDNATKNLALQTELREFEKQQREAVREAIQGQKTHTQATEEFVRSLERRGAVLEDITKFQLQFNSLLLDTHSRLKNINAEIDHFVNALPQMDVVFPALGESQIGAAAGAAANAQLGAPPVMAGIAEQIDVFQELGTVISDTFNLGKEGAVAFADVLSSAFGQVASAVGSAVQAFVLFGTAQGGFKKFAAEVIASVAQMAAVQAVFELAQALAMIALTWFTGNPKYAQSAGAHFAAAAAYGAIAGVTAGVGRVVAGNSFNQSAGGSGGGGGAGSPSGTSTRSAAPIPVEMDRRTLNQQAITRELKFVVKGEAVVDKFVEDFNLNGRTRVIITSER